MNSIIKGSPSLQEAHHILKIHTLIFTFFLLSIIIQLLADLINDKSFIIFSFALIYLMMIIIGIFFGYLIFRFNEKNINKEIGLNKFFSWLSYLRIERSFKN